MKPRYKWRPLQRAHVLPANEELISVTMGYYNLDREAALKLLDDDAGRTEVWKNDLYQVQTRRMSESETGWMHINIRRVDGGPIMRDWRHFQWIKNQLAGEECEAVEIYPAESRHVDTSNKYHLWACLDPTFRFPFGFDKRDVSYETGKSAGLRQRPL